MVRDGQGGANSAGFDNSIQTQRSSCPRISQDYMYVIPSTVKVPGSFKGVQSIPRTITSLSPTDPDRPLQYLASTCQSVHICRLFQCTRTIFQHLVRLIKMFVLMESSASDFIELLNYSLNTTVSMDTDGAPDNFRELHVVTLYFACSFDVFTEKHESQALTEPEFAIPLLKDLSKPRMENHPKARGGSICKECFLLVRIVKSLKSTFIYKSSVQGLWGRMHGGVTVMPGKSS